MANTFSLSDRIASMILSQYHQYLRSNHDDDDNLYKKCHSELLALQTVQIQTLLESLYDASMKREEGRNHHFNVVLSPSLVTLANEIKECPWHGCLHDITAFEKPIPIADLPKIAPAFEGTHQSLRVWFNSENEVEIWGFGSGYLDFYGLKIQPLNLGELLVDIKSLDFPWVRFLLTFAHANVVERSSPIHRLISVDTEATVHSDEWHQEGQRQTKVFGFMVDIINKMSLHAHGGTMLFIPAEKADEIIHKSIREGIPLRPDGNYSVIKNKLDIDKKEFLNSLKSETRKRSSRRNFEKEADLLGQFTAVDGATLLTKDFEVLAIGAKIRESDEEGIAQRKIWVQIAYQDSEAMEKNLSDIGGTRHQSAAHFVFDNKTADVFAVVASQDGKISIIYWDEREHKLMSFVHAEYSYRGIKYS